MPYTYFLFTPFNWSFLLFFFFNDTATTEIYTLSLHDALPILNRQDDPQRRVDILELLAHEPERDVVQDRKSTRLNSSHLGISYAVFCLKKKTPRESSIRDISRCDSSECSRKSRKSSVDRTGFV